MSGIKVDIDVKEAKIASENFKRYMRAMGISTEKAEEEAKKLEGRLKKRLGADKAKAALNQLTESARMTRLQIAKLQIQSRNFGGALTTLKGKASALTAGVLSLKTAFIGLGVGLITRQLIGQFSTFESALTDMAKVTDRSLAEIRKEVMSLPPALGTATELMRGYYQVISAGVQGTDKQLKTLIITSKAAIAAHVSQAEVIKGLTGVVDAYGKKIKGVAEAADMLYTIEKLGKTNVAELIPVIGSLASMSAVLGISQDELGASLAQTTKFIGSTAEAATQMEALLTALVRGTERSAKMFEEHGGALKAIKKIGFVNVLKKMTDATRGNQQALQKLIGGEKTALFAVLALSKEGYVPLLRNMDEMSKKAGAMDRAWINYLGTYDAVALAFSSTIGKVMIEFGEDIAPVVMQGMRDIADEMSKAYDEGRVEDWANKIGEIGSTVLSTTTAMVKIYNALPVAAVSSGLVMAILFKSSAQMALLVGGMVYVATHLDDLEWSLKEINKVAKKDPFILGPVQILLEAMKEAGIDLIDTYEKIRRAREKIDSKVRLPIKQRYKIIMDESDVESAEKTAFKIKEIEEKTAAKIKKIQAKLLDAYNKVALDKFEYAKGKLSEELEINKKVAQLKYETTKKLYTKEEQALTVVKDQLLKLEAAALAGSLQAQQIHDEKLNSLTEGRTKAELTARRDMYADMKGYEADYYALSVKLIDMQVTAYVKAGGDILLAEEHAAKEKEKIRKKLADDERAQTIKRVQEWIQAQEAMRVGWEVEPLPPLFDTEETQKVTIEQITALRNMYEDMNQYGTEYYDESMKLIDLQAKAYAEASKDSVLAEKWATNEKKKLSEARTKMVLSETAGMLGNYASFFQYMGQKSKKWFEIYKMTAIAQAMIKTYQGAVEAFTALAGIPVVGPALGTAAAAAAVAAGMAQVAMISSQEAPSTAMAKGGWLNAHPGGGKIGVGSGTKDDVFLGSTPGVNHFGMKDEFVFIMNKEATKRNGALLEAMNKGFAGGGWVNRGYGLLDSVGTPGLGLPIVGPIVEWLQKIWEELTAPPEIPEIPFDPKVFTGILDSIDQMLDKTTALEDAVNSANQQFDQWRDQLIEMNATIAQLSEVEDQREAVLAHIAAEMVKDFIEPLEAIIREGTLSNLSLQVHQLNEWYREQSEIAEELGLSLDTVNQAYAVQLQQLQEEVTQTWEDINREITLATGTMTDFQWQVIGVNDQFDNIIERMKEMNATEADLARVEEARIGAMQHLIDIQKESLEADLEQRLTQLTLAETPEKLAIYNLTKEFTEVIEQIREWSDVTGEGYEDLIAQTTKVYELEMEAAIKQSETYQKLQSSIDEWTNIAKSLEQNIFDLQTSLASPEDVLERMGRVWSEIQDVETGGADTPEEIQKLQELYIQYLTMAQEAYQRPSSEYQAIYDTVIGALEDLKTDAEDFASIYDIQQQTMLSLVDNGKTAAQILNEISTGIMAGIPVDVTMLVPDIPPVIVDIPDVTVNVELPDIPSPEVITPTIPDVNVNVTTVVNETILNDQKAILEQIRSNTYAAARNLLTVAGNDFQWITYPKYAKYGGIFTGPESGYPVILHGTEKVTPVGKDYPEINMTINVNESKTPRATGQAVRKELEGFLKSSRGRKIVQQTSIGRG